MMKIKKLILGILVFVFVFTAYSHTYEEIVNMPYEQRIEVLKQMTPEQQKEYFEWKAEKTKPVTKPKAKPLNDAAKHAAGSLKGVNKKKETKDKKLEETMKSMNQN